VSVVGGLFDITPPRLIKAIVTELGPIPPSACINVMWNMKRSRRISELLPDWAHGRL
jgi:translation initiation factor 2B subunit (eIF-2B alpha/beta/delta family)